MNYVNIDYDYDESDLTQTSVEPQGPRRGTFLTLSELANIPPPPPLVDDLINLDSITMLVGSSRAFKSFVMLGMSCAIAHPQMNNWEGHKIHEHGTVAYIAAEGGNGIYPRILAWCIANGVSIDELQDRLLVNRDAVQLTSAEDMEYQLQQFGQMPDLKMVVFDTKARVSGDLEENSATDQKQAIDMVDFIKRETGAAIVLIHHSGKDGTGARGSSAWIGAIDTELTATRDGDEMMVNLKTTKRKDSKDAVDYRYELKEYEFGEFFDVTTSLVAVAMREDESHPHGGKGVGHANEVRALKRLDEQDDGSGVTKAHWVTTLKEDGMARNTAYDTVARLIRTGKAQEVTVQKGSGHNREWVGNGRYQAFSGLRNPDYQPGLD